MTSICGEAVESPARSSNRPTNPSASTSVAAASRSRCRAWSGSKRARHPCRSTGPRPPHRGRRRRGMARARPVGDRQRTREPGRGRLLARPRDPTGRRRGEPGARTRPSRREMGQRGRELPGAGYIEFEGEWMTPAERQSILAQRQATDDEYRRARTRPGSSPSRPSRERRKNAKRPRARRRVAACLCTAIRSTGDGGQARVTGPGFRSSCRPPRSAPWEEVGNEDHETSAAFRDSLSGSVRALYGLLVTVAGRRSRRDRRLQSRRPRRQGTDPGPAFDPGDRNGPCKQETKNPGGSGNQTPRPLPPRILLSGNNQRLRARRCKPVGRSHRSRVSSSPKSWRRRSTRRQGQTSEISKVLSWTGARRAARSNWSAARRSPTARPSNSRSHSRMAPSVMTMSMSDRVRSSALTLSERSGGTQSCSRTRSRTSGRLTD